MAVIATDLLVSFVSVHVIRGQLMCQASNPSRRQFIQSAGIAVGMGGIVISSLGQTNGEPVGGAAASREPAEVLERLLAGNKRFMAGQSTNIAKTPADFARHAQGQAPAAAIVSCADSRVPPELIFDQGVGDLFVVRVAGNVISSAGAIVKGSIEFAVAELGVRLIVVLGHSHCGAVAAAIKHLDVKGRLPGSIEGLVDLVRPAVESVKQDARKDLDVVIRANVARCVARAKGADPILSKFVDQGKLQVVGGVYDLSTGKVEMVA